MIKAGIVGGAGYAGGELIRLLLHHPHVRVEYVLSNSQKGKKLSDLHYDLLSQTDLVFESTYRENIDILFICSGHGQSKKFLQENEVASSITVIDLSSDFRLKENGNDFIYGLCELNKEDIKSSKRIANCGCFASCIQLGLLPSAKAGWLQSEIHVNAITGSTGAGQAKLDTTHFSWRNNNISVYKAFRHQHLDEIIQSLKQEDLSFDQTVNFIPVRGDFTRGIYASMYFNCNQELAEVRALYQNYYSSSPFVHITNHNPSLKEVVNTNMCHIYIDKIDNKLMIISMLDNLLKGAAGQAVQNMNIAFGFEEKSGLNLKATVY